MNNKLIAQPQTGRWLYLFLVVHFLAWSLVPSLIRYNLPLDAIEGTIWGNHLQWGYDKDPFLNAWLTSLAIHLDHYSGWMLYVFSQVFVTASLWVVWQLGRSILSPAYALLAVLMLEGMQYFNFHAIDFNDNTIELGLWALTTYFFYKALTRPSHLQWILTGLFAGLCMMAKYYTAALLAAMALYLLIRPENRRQLATLSPYLGLLTFILVILPHLLWLWSNGFVTIIYVTLRAATDEPSWTNHLSYPAQFIWEQFQVFIPTLIFFGLLFLGKKPRLAKPGLAVSSFNKSFLFYMGLGPLLLTALLSVFTGTKLRAGWGMPLLTLWSLLLFAHLQPRISTKKIHAFLAGIFCFMALLLSAYVVSLTHSSKTSSANFPGRKIAETVSKLWQDTYHSQLTYLAGSRWIGGNISFYASNHPAVFVEWKKEYAPWINTADLRKKGGVFVWDITEGESLPAEVRAQYPRLSKTIVLSFDWHRNRYNLPPQKIGIAFLPPEDKQS